MLNPSVVLYGARNAAIEDRPVPQIVDAHDVIVRIAFVGVCGSDVHFWEDGGIGTKATSEAPVVMGHEASGIVHAIGSGVASVEVGDHVAIEPGYPCRRCKACKNGKYHLCQMIQFAAAPPNKYGTLSKFFVVPEDFLYKVPPAISLQEAVLIEPLAVAIHSVRLADVRPGQGVIVTGSGTVGLLCGAAAKAFGANPLMMVDIAEHKLEFARRFLSCSTFLSNTASTLDQNCSDLLKIFGNSGRVDAVIEASGAESSVQMGIHTLSPGGTYVQTGIGKHVVGIPMLQVLEKELKVLGSFRYGSGDYELAVKLLETGAVSVKPLISSVTPFEKTTKAWDKTAGGEGIKNLIQGVLE